MVRPVLLAILGIVAASATISAQDQDSGGPEANPGRPTISTPATLTPVGYLQLETGALGAWYSSEFSSQRSVNAVFKFSVSTRLELLAASEPFAHSRAGGQSTNAAGDLSFGFQGLVRRREGASPTIALSYFRRARGGSAPDLDFGSPTNSVVILDSADVKHFHYDLNAMLNELIAGPVHRLQLGQSLSISHPLRNKFGITGEIWHFTQPFLKSNAVGNLWALTYTPNRNLVFDAGFNRGLTSTSTRWEVFVGFTYLFPHKLRCH